MPEKFASYAGNVITDMVAWTITVCGELPSPILDSFQIGMQI
jgi:hypothetical protein